MNYFFILSLGRSGTKFLSNLFNTNKNLICLHEPNKVDDYINLPLSYYYPNSSILHDSLTNRFNLIKNTYKSDSEIEAYGEVNSLLRYNAEWLKRNLNAKIVSIARDPKKVIRSIYLRNVYIDHKGSHMPIMPKNEDPYVNEWVHMNRFERICWYWKHTNQHLIRYNFPIYKFERLIDNYDTFLGLIEQLGISNIDKKTWKKLSSKPLNNSKNFKNNVRYFMKKIIGLEKYERVDIGQYDSWTKPQKDSFKKICGKVANDLGYET